MPECVGGPSSGSTEMSTKANVREIGVDGHVHVGLPVGADAEAPHRHHPPATLGQPGLVVLVRPVRPQAARLQLGISRRVHDELGGSAAACDRSQQERRDHGRRRVAPGCPCSTPRSLRRAGRRVRRPIRTRAATAASATAGGRLPSCGRSPVRGRGPVRLSATRRARPSPRVQRPCSSAARPRRRRRGRRAAAHRRSGARRDRGGRARPLPDRRARDRSSPQPLLVHALAQPRERADHARLHGAQRETGPRGDLGLRQLVVEPQLQELAFERRQRAEQVRDEPPVDLGVVRRAAPRPRAGRPDRPATDDAGAARPARVSGRS